MTELNFCFDRLMEPTIPFPNLARLHAEPRTPEWYQFDHHWPHSIPLRLLTYLRDAHVDFRLLTIWNDFEWAWYPIALGWFDLDLDYFAMFSDVLRQRIQRRQIGVLFYYHEGDNPYRIKNKIDLMADRNDLPRDCYRFISANTAARDIPGFMYLPDHEFWFRHVNRNQAALTQNRAAGPWVWTAVNRTHKTWRAAMMSGLWRHGLLENSMWSYNTANVSLTQDTDPSAIDLTHDREWQAHMDLFLARTPHHCDDLDQQQHNNHERVNPDLFRSRCHFVLETHFDVDQSDGVFLTEKTFKPIKYGQPFVIAGAAGSIQELRDMGYRTFDSVINHGYDSIADNYDRARALIDTARRITRDSIHMEWWEAVRPDIAHNQEMFQARIREPIYHIVKELQCR